MSDRIPLTVPDIGPEELKEIETVLDSGYLTQGPAVERFETAVADYVGVESAFATSSCTTALHLSLAALGVGPGDDVIVPAFTFPATANVVVQIGARPVLADIDLATYAATAETLDAAMTDRTAAVMPVDPFGYPAPMASIVEWARSRGVRVIEDAATALGTSSGGRRHGSFPDLACFSFHPRKIITTGEGGMITTDDPEIAERIRLLRSHGGVRIDGRFTFTEAGYNYRMSDVNGAVGIAQMRRLDGIIAARRAMAAALSERLRVIPGIVVPAEDELGATYQSYVVRLEQGIDREEVIRDLGHLGIESTIGTYGLHLEPYFRDTFGLQPSDLPNATIAGERTMTLPLFPGMVETDITRIADAVGVVLSGGAES